MPVQRELKHGWGPGVRAARDELAEPGGHRPIESRGLVVFRVFLDAYGAAWIGSAGTASAATTWPPWPEAPATGYLAGSVDKAALYTYPFTAGQVSPHYPWPTSWPGAASINRPGG